MMNVILTIDTETYPLRKEWRAERLQCDIGRDVYGVTSAGEFGLSYQIEVLNSHALKGVFFVESLFVDAVGTAPLERIVDEIQHSGHEVQMHPHPEWLSWVEQPAVDGDGRGTMRQFTEGEQTAIVARAIEKLRAAGARRVCAFRAGDFAANADTLSALRHNGIRFDTSCNACYPDSLADVPELAGALQPRNVNGLWEFPVSSWRCGSRRWRHAQISAASFGEMKGALDAAWAMGWQWFVIVSHSFELLKNRRQRFEDPAPDQIAVRRFIQLCHYLRSNRDKFNVCGFSDVDLSAITLDRNSPSITSPMYRTAWRVLQQAYRRVT